MALIKLIADIVRQWGATSAVPEHLNVRFWPKADVQIREVSAV